MKTALFSFILLFSTLTFADNNHKHWMFSKYPLNQEFPLSTGQIVQLPFHIYDADALLLAGTADLQKLEGVLKPFNLQPAKLTDGKGLMGFYFLNYKDTVIGGYGEVMFVIFVKNPENHQGSQWKDYLSLLATYVPELHALGDSAEQTGLMIIKLWVTSDLAIHAGNEIWGSNKTMADVNLKISAGQAKLNLSDKDGWIMQANHKRLFAPRILPLRMDAVVTFPTGVVTRAIARSQMSVHPWDKKKDSYQANSADQWGKMVNDVKFKPLFWQNITDFKSILFAP